MKTFFYSVCILFTSLASCKSTSSPEIPSFLPGIYASSTDLEFCSIADTMIIRRIDLTGNVYKITRRVSFTRIKDSKRLPPEYEEQQWMAKFDPVKKELTTDQQNIPVRYAAEENRIYKDYVAYDKIE